MSTAKILRLLTHPIAQDAMRSIGQGSDPRGVLAGMAGDLFAQEVAKAIGAKGVAKLKAEKAAAPKAEPIPKAPGVKHRPKVEVVSEDDVVDADYTVINVTPREAKKAGPEHE
jgi:hypothetical protein